MLQVSAHDGELEARGVNINFQGRLLLRLNAKAEEQGITVPELVTRILKEYFGLNPKPLTDNEIAKRSGRHSI